MLDTPQSVLHFLLRLGYPTEEVAQQLIDQSDIAADVAHACALEVARRIQEEDIEFAHTIIEHEAAIAAEWRE